MIVTFAVFVVPVGLLLAEPSLAQSAPQTDAPGAKAAAATDFSAQSRVRRARTRIRVQPLYPYRRYHSLYPLPYDIEYPGPNARRDCAVRYVNEYRPSGAVVVPRMNCWWVRG
jgi:hypothetical protein